MFLLLRMLTSWQACNTKATVRSHIDYDSIRRLNHSQLSFTINNVTYPISIADWIFDDGAGATGDVCVGSMSTTTGYESPE